MGMDEIEIRPDTEDFDVLGGQLAAAGGALPPSTNPFVAYIDSLRSPESRRTMRGCLTYVAQKIGFERPEDVPWHLLKPHIVKHLRMRMLEQTYTDHNDSRPWSPATVNKHLAAIRGIVTTAWKNGLMDTNTYMEIKNERGISLDRPSASPSITAPELRSMLKHCLDGSLIGIRNAAMIAVFASTGAKRSELAKARREHYEPATRTLKLFGKSGTERDVHVPETAAVYLEAWLAQSDTKNGPMFGHVTRWGTQVDKHLTGSAVGLILDRSKKEAVLFDEPKSTTPGTANVPILDLLFGRTDVGDNHTGDPACWYWDSEAPDVSNLIHAGLEVEALTIWQRNRCAICEANLSAHGVVDRDRNNGLLRGILCEGCAALERTADSQRLWKYRISPASVWAGLYDESTFDD